MLSVFRAGAQDSTHTAKDKQLQQVLGMTNQQYSNYSKGLREHDKRLKEVLEDKNLDKNARGAATEKILKERKAYMEQNLSEQQRKKLSEFNRQNLTVSPRAKHQKEVEERIARRGIRVVKDSTTKKR